VRGTDVLGALLKGSFGMLEERARDAREDEWHARAVPGTNKPGFILWHCARILDWTVNLAIQGVPEVAASVPWVDRFPLEAGAGFGITQSLADRIAETVSAQELSGYLAGVRNGALEWFGRQTDDSLDLVPSMRANQQLQPFYLEPQVWAEVSDLDGLPAWQLLMRPAGAHIRRHVGEYDLLVEVLREGATTTRA
jgi:hypothetical protein